MKNAINKRVIELIDYFNISGNEFAKRIGIPQTTFSNIINRDSDIKASIIEAIITQFGDISLDWLITGNGEMLKSDTQLVPDVDSKRNRIPFYDDISTIGGMNDCVANVDPAHPSDWIDAGDWFPEATAAIRHYGDSMVEYPSGSILAIKRVNDPRLMMNGRNYVIETTEYRVTKQIQDGGDHFMAYSTNRDTYPDGQLIHSPFPVPKDAILHIDLVLGCVTKEYSNGAIQIRK